MNELLKSNWNYILYEKGDTLILSVVCGTVGLYDINIVLLPSEKEKYNKEGVAFIEQLAENIRSTPKNYQERHVKL